MSLSRAADLSRALRVPAHALLLCGYAAFLAANLIHNRFGLDPAVVPATLFVATLFWRGGRGFAIGAAAAIALPALLFLQWAALTDPAETHYFLNHVALLIAGVLAGAAAVLAVLPSYALSLEE